VLVPGLSDALRALEDRERNVRAAQHRTHREAGRSCADDERVGVCRNSS
jgi:hypothetical protein